jgi:hypothetical protein
MSLLGSGKKDKTKKISRATLANQVDWSFSSEYNVKKLLLTSPTGRECIAKEFINHATLFGALSDFQYMDAAQLSASVTSMKNLLVSQVVIHDISDQEIVEWTGGSWMYTTGRQEMRRADITFKDFNGGITYYTLKYMLSIFPYLYPEDQYWTIAIYSIIGSSFRNFSNDNAKQTFITSDFPIIYTERAILFKLGQLTLNQEQAGLMTFTASFLYDQEDKLILDELDEAFSKNGKPAEKNANTDNAIPSSSQKGDQRPNDFGDKNLPKGGNNISNTA